MYDCSVYEWCRIDKTNQEAGKRNRYNSTIRVEVWKRQPWSTLLWPKFYDSQRSEKKEIRAGFTTCDA